MSKELFVSSTPHETKVAIVEDDQLAEIYFERENEYTLAGSVYKGRVTRVLPGMQSAFVEIGLERDAFLYVTDFFEQPDEEGEIERLPVAEEAGGASLHRQAQPQTQNTASSQENATSSHEARGDEGANPETAPSPGEESAAASPHSENAPADRESSGFGARRRRGRRGRGLPESKFARPEDGRPPRPASPPAGQEPIILPGESISKYRRTQTTESQLSPQAAAPPSAPPAPHTRPEQVPAATPAGTQRYTSPLTLPGESISKYRNVSSPPAHPGAQTDGEGTEMEATGEAPRRPTEEIDVRAILARHVPQESHEAEKVSSASSSGSHGGQPEAQPSLQAHQPAFSSDVLEEEELDEEESEDPSYAQSLDEDEFEEMEEETLERAGALERAETDEHAGVENNLAQPATAARRGEEREALKPHAAPGTQPMDLAPQPEYPETATEEEEEEASRNYSAAAQQAQDEAEAEAENATEISGEELEEEELSGASAGNESIAEGRAEIRGPSGYQQKVGFERRRGRRGGRRMRGPGARRMHHGLPPKISDLLKEGQETLVQIAKEPIGKKGARITSHIALPGRFLVYMPTVNHNGVSRKIASEEERQRLKRIILSERQSGGNGHQGGFIVRTAAASASEEDLRADIRFLLNLWSEIKTRAESAKAPALIYHDLNLVERILRDQVSEGFSHIWVDSEQEYERVLRFINRFQPSLVKRVKLYSKETPLFEQFNIQDEINKALKSKVWLKSGGYIVINQTEALVAIDVNTGKYVGKTQRLEDTIVKTNVDAIKEIVRQIRLRDLGGIIVIDFIDMDERRNRQKVMQALEEALKSDRAPSKVLQFNDFGLVAITRKRVKQSLERTLGQPCTYCTGTGLIKSVATVCNEIYVEMRKMMRHLEHNDVILRVNPEVGKALKANNARWLQDMEDLTGKTVIVKPDPTLHQEQFDIH